jgi:hypothetical protein
MSVVRNLGSDLVDKRLWPIAAALLAAIAIVPLLLMGGSAKTAKPGVTPVVPAPAHTAVAPSVKVTLDDAAPAAARDRAGRVRNPFIQLHQAKAAGTTTTSGGVTAVSPAATGSAPATTPVKITPITLPVTTTPAKTTPVATKPTATKPAATTHAAAKKVTAFRVAWRFGAVDAVAGNHNAARLTALPSAKQPAVMFLGLLRTSHAAVFLVNANAAVTGDGKCQPTPARCATVTLHAGDHELFAFGDVAYVLHVRNIAHRKVSAAAAKRSRLRESKAGRALLRDAVKAGIPGSDLYAFDKTTGLLRSAVKR